MLCIKNVPSKAESRGSMPFDFCIGTSRVIAVAATRLRKRTLAILAASISSLWMLSNGSRRGMTATAKRQARQKQRRPLLSRSNRAND